MPHHRNHRNHRGHGHNGGGGGGRFSGGGFAGGGFAGQRKAMIRTVRKMQQHPQEAVDQFWGRFDSVVPGKATSLIPHPSSGPSSSPSSSSKPCSTYDEARSQCITAVEKIVQQCLRLNTKYTDTSFDLEFDLKFGSRDSLDSLGNKFCALDGIVGNDGGRGRGGYQWGQRIDVEDCGTEYGDGDDDYTTTKGHGGGGTNREPDIPTAMVASRTNRITTKFQPQNVKRVPDIFTNPQFFINGPTAKDVRQGHNVGDCWLMAALCTMGNKGGLIERICVARREDVGVYGFVFCRDGEWVWEVIDDKLYLSRPDYNDQGIERHIWNDREREDPEEAYRRTYLTGSGALYFAQCEDPNETWLPLLEKAYAKAHGDYGAIEGGFIGEGIEDLCGGVTTEVYTTDILDKERFWGELLRVNEEFLFGCSTGFGGRGTGEREGVIELHSYSVMKAVEVDGKRLCLLKNPWGKGEWKGAWSDGSKEWTPEWMAKLSHRFGNDGSFYIEYSDLLRTYQVFDRTRLFLNDSDNSSDDNSSNSINSSNWKVTNMWTTLQVPWTLDYQSTYFTLSLRRPGPVVLVLSQIDDRYFRGLEGKYFFELSFQLHHRRSPSDSDSDDGSGKNEIGDYIVHSQKGYRLKRSVNVELPHLEAGDYVVLTKIEASRDEEVLPVEDVVTLHARDRRKKLARVGAAYDIAHAKGVIQETAPEKRGRKKWEARMKEKEKQGIRDMILKTRFEGKVFDMRDYRRFVRRRRRRNERGRRDMERFEKMERRRVEKEQREWERKGGGGGDDGLAPGVGNKRSGFHRGDHHHRHQPHVQGQGQGQDQRRGASPSPSRVSSFTARQPCQTSPEHQESFHAAQSQEYEDISASLLRREQGQEMGVLLGEPMVVEGEQQRQAQEGWSQGQESREERQQGEQQQQERGEGEGKDRQDGDATAEGNKTPPPARNLMFQDSTPPRFAADGRPLGRLVEGEGDGARESQVQKHSHHDRSQGQGQSQGHGNRQQRGPGQGPGRGDHPHHQGQGGPPQGQYHGPPPPDQQRGQGQQYPPPRQQHGGGPRRHGPPGRPNGPLSVGTPSPPSSISSVDEDLVELYMMRGQGGENRAGPSGGRGGGGTRHGDRGGEQHGGGRGGGGLGAGYGPGGGNPNFCPGPVGGGGASGGGGGGQYGTVGGGNMGGGPGGPGGDNGDAAVWSLDWEDEIDPWNAAVVVGLRVYYKEAQDHGEKNKEGEKKKEEGGQDVKEHSGNPVVVEDDATKAKPEETEKPVIATAPRGPVGAQGAAAGSNHALRDYQVQLLLLEQQCKKRALMARQQGECNRANANATGAPRPKAEGVSSPRAGDRDGRKVAGSEGVGKPGARSEAVVKGTLEEQEVDAEEVEEEEEEHKNLYHHHHRRRHRHRRCRHHCKSKVYERGSKGNNNDKGKLKGKGKERESKDDSRSKSKWKGKAKKGRNKYRDKHVLSAKFRKQRETEIAKSKAKNPGRGGEGDKKNTKKSKEMVERDEDENEMIVLGVVRPNPWEYRSTSFSSSSSSSSSSSDSGSGSGSSSSSSDSGSDSDSDSDSGSSSSSSSGSDTGSDGASGSEFREDTSYFSYNTSLGSTGGFAWDDRANYGGGRKRWKRGNGDGKTQKDERKVVRGEGKKVIKGKGKRRDNK